MVRKVMMRKLPTMFVNCWVRLPQHEGNRATRIYSSAERASVDFEHSARNCNSGDQRGRGGQRGGRQGRRGKVGVKVKLGGVAVELTFLSA